MSKILKNAAATDQPAPRTGRYGSNRFLWIVAGLGGLLCGMDAGIIAGVLLPHAGPDFRHRHEWGFMTFGDSPVILNG